MGVRRVSEGVWVLEDGHAVVSQVDTDKFNVDRQVGAVSNVSTAAGDFWVKYWGKNNLQPQEREDLIKENNILGELLRAKRNLALGSGLVPYRERFEGGEMVRDWIQTPPEIEEWMKRAKFKQYLRTAGKNLEMHGNIFTELVRTREGKIASVKCLESAQVRAEKKDVRGRIRNYLWCGNWYRAGKKYRGEEWPVQRIAAYDPEATTKQAKFVIHTGDDFLCDGYYHTPAWWGGRYWVMLANVIPLFHLNNLKHGYVVRWHIEIPKDYFYDYTLAQQTPDKRDEIRAAAEQAEQEFLDRMNAFLAGLENTGRAVFSKYEINKAMGKEFPGIKITPMNFDMKDEALLKLLEKGVQMVIAGQGIHPTLANVETQGKLASGTEFRNAYLFYIATRTPAARDILMEVVDFVHTEQGWDPTIKWWFKDIELTKLDDEPTGNTTSIIK